ncbi:MAG: RagB/SusD family nutrient uptake outer membrane protein [Bacteroidetes bacterium]|nr:RagB/SusD family nutrient uptake outer membrane protein [Bacteroidota bacterium]
MKKIIKMLVVFGLAAVSGGCKKYLDQTPENSITGNNFFKTKADAQASVIACYDALQAATTQFLNWGEFRGDLLNPLSNSDVTYPFYQYMDKTRPVSNWAVAYTLIGRTNTVIQSVPGVLNADSKFTLADSRAMVAEALFLRSLAYFYLVRTFQDVPLVLTAPTSDAVNYFIPKSPSDSILNKIQMDLDTAALYIPVRYDKDIDTRGRVTKAAVNALQAEVYLWRDKYKPAADAAQKVLDNTALYSLVSGANWISIFNQKNTTESVFEVEYDYTLNETNGLLGAIGNFNANDVLVSYFTGDEGQNNAQGIRGLNKTYISGNSYWKWRGFSTGTTNVVRPTNDPNFIVYRLPDVMLMKAEALVNIQDADSVNEKQQALDIINVIRTRGQVPIYDNLDGNAPASLIMDLIMKERAMELAGEGKRWYDLVRGAKRNNFANPGFLIDRVVQSRSVGDRALIKSRIIDPRSWYMPIFLDELNKNPKLVQNPYYN